jgi:15-cis-phytoene synthase
MLQASSENTPRSSLRPPSAADQAYCRALLKGGSRSFYAASFLLPSPVRDPAVALYAFCRLADDAVDEGDGKPEIIARLHQRLDCIYAGDPQPHPADRAFAAVAARFHLPRAVVDALIEGFAWDLSGRRYKTFADVQDYAARVAGCVGIMMTTIMGAREANVLARAADLGVAMQLTNIARDVGEDARNGRLYLPTDWLHEAGIDPEAFLANPVFTPKLGDVIARLLAEAEQLYIRANAGIALLPANCRPGIRAARLIYAAIGHAVEKQRFDSIRSRAFVPTATKLRLMSRTVIAVPADPLLKSLPPLAATAFLVEAVLAMPAPAETAASLAWWNLSDRFMPVLDIFEKLKRIEQGKIGKPGIRVSSMRTG